ncbi:MAG: hypothetical protein ACO25B_05420 [Chitinophagaceae bacterium]
MKNPNHIHVISWCMLVFSLASCQKDSAPADYTTESTVHADDQNRFSVELDAIANDANLILETIPGFAGRGEDVQSLICDATIGVDTASNPRTITVTYNGTNCPGGRTRTGVIVISMAQGVRWKNPGASLQVEFQNLRITRLIDQKSITINGTQTYTNVTGGLLINLPGLNNITHRITSNNMTLAFDNNSLRQWNVARERIFTYNNGTVISVTGLHTEGNISGIAEWGTNRFGNAFTTSISQPLVFKQDCGFRLGAGKLIHKTAFVICHVTLGLDAGGNPVSCPGANPYFMKVVWTGPEGNSHSGLFPY